MRDGGERDNPGVFFLPDSCHFRYPTLDFCELDGWPSPRAAGGVARAYDELFWEGSDVSNLRARARLFSRRSVRRRVVCVETFIEARLHSQRSPASKKSAIRLILLPIMRGYPTRQSILRRPAATCVVSCQA